MKHRTLAVLDLTRASCCYQTGVGGAGRSEVDHETVLGEVEGQLRAVGEQVGGGVGEDDPPAGEFVAVGQQVGVPQVVRNGLGEGVGLGDEQVSPVGQFRQHG